MSRIINFIKRNKEFGGYRNGDDNYEYLGFLDGQTILEYFSSNAGIAKEEIGDIVHFSENEDGLWLDSEETYRAFLLRKMDRFLEFANLKPSKDVIVYAKRLKTAMDIASADYLFKASKENPLSDDVTYLMTQERKDNIFNAFAEWKEEIMETSDDPEWDIERTEQNLKKLREIISQVDFETENLYFGYSW